MSSRHFFFAILIFSLLVIGLVSATMKGDKIFPSATLAISETQRQVQGVSSDKYYAALLSHSANTIPPNVNQESKIASETAHPQEGDAAQNIAELGKRQNNSGNETSSTQTTSPTETSSRTLLPTTSTTTGSSTTSTQSTTSSSVTGISSTSTTSETTTSQSSVTVSSVPSTVSSSMMTTDSKSSNTTPSSIMKDSSSSTTSPPTTAQSITSLHVFTTQEGGAVVTVTELTVVPAPIAQETDSAGSGPTKSPSLQPNGASIQTPGMKVMLCVLGAAFLAAF
ncbi:hypothetical protein OIDMADRAFT_17982 [Oidiodendron maius Zn]|uniref:Uncharacterized protein n=1 Tax=Oidiodendron maius (strain Zn) TaxID=913774 RepID=A0A0C3CXG7_OIDMZ|nr:hypothetical protein OIDMADRAFT_17982 [Oidiodendron maius Zn]